MSWRLRRQQGFKGRQVGCVSSRGGAPPESLCQWPSGSVSWPEQHRPEAWALGAHPQRLLCRRRLPWTAVPASCSFAAAAAAAAAAAIGPWAGPRPGPRSLLSSPSPVTVRGRLGLPGPELGLQKRSQTRAEGGKLLRWEERCREVLSGPDPRVAVTQPAWS